MSAQCTNVNVVADGVVVNMTVCVVVVVSGTVMVDVMMVEVLGIMVAWM